MQHKELFRSCLLNWYSQYGRDLPWRKTRDPYAILVSEFMLQQTQVAIVLPYYRNWLRRFPDFKTLAGASEHDVLHAWQGLGYYTRARNLHTAAKAVQDAFGEVFPSEIGTMRELPGVGRYTANAVATFAFDRPVPIVEANTARVLARVFNINVPIDSALGRDTLWNRATQLVPKQSAGRFNSALMDLGALVCLPRTPKCGICPISEFCRAKNPAVLPIKRPQAPVQELSEAHAFVVQQDKILLEQSRTRWRGMWILPRLKSQPKSARPIHSSTFPFTHHRVKLSVFRQKPCAPTRQRRWFCLDEMDSIPVPSPHRRAIIELLANANCANRTPRSRFPS